MDTAPPYATLADARTQGGDTGVRALLAWYVAQPSYRAAAIRLGTGTSAMLRAAARVGVEVPDRSDRRGAPRGSDADRRAKAARTATKKGAS